MAREEADREDLLAEATALVERVALLVDDLRVVVGFRRDGAASFYFGADPVYQFNARGELRRAYCGGLLYRAVQGRVVELRRDRAAKATVLRRRDLRDDEQINFLAAADQRLRSLSAALRQSRTVTLGQVSDDGQAVSRVQKWLAEAPRTLAVAHSPRAGGG